MGTKSKIPESWHHTDPETLVSLDRWIETIHPKSCLKTLDELLDKSEFRYRITIQKLIAHCLDQHEQGISILMAHRMTSYPQEAKETGLATSICACQNRIIEEIWAKIAELNNEPSSPGGMYLILTSIDDAHFESFWNRIWHEGVAENAPRIAGAAFRSAAFSKHRSSYAASLLMQRPNELFKIMRDDLVDCLVDSRELEETREDMLVGLLTEFEFEAAASIVRATESSSNPPRCTPNATRIIMQRDPENDLVPVGVGSSIGIDDDFALTAIVEWTNHSHSRFMDNHYLKWRIGSLDQGVLLSALAFDAMKLPRNVHQTLAMIHHGIVADMKAVIRWLEQTTENLDSSLYNASLSIWYLSEPPGTTTSAETDALIKMVHKMHEIHGHSSKGDVEITNGLSDKNLEDRESLLAIALAKDVMCERPTYDGEAVLREIRKYPFTYEALGGKALDNEIVKGRFPVCSPTFSTSLEDQSLDEYWKSRINATRNGWEEVFSKIARAGVKIPSRNLRHDECAWHEMRILACLVDKFSATYEPSDLRWMKGKKPEFLLKSPDGDLVLEVVSVRSKPDEIREGTRGVAGVNAKNSLMRKWREKFNRCNLDARLPIVIAVQTRWRDDFEFDMVGSLYGPEQIKVALDPRIGRAVSQKLTRGYDKGFFSLQCVGCISAVAGVKETETPYGKLEGELFRPTYEPWNSISQKLWIRLRSALFGEKPANLVSRMMQIPDIRIEEAELLVDYGVDDLGFFATGLIDYPEGIPLSIERFDRLRENARMEAERNQNLTRPE